MKVWVLSFVMSLCLFGSSALAGPQDFTLVNGSASYICYLYISPSSSDDWEEDVLGEDCLSPGESIRINFNAGSEPLWDLRVEDEDGNYEEYSSFNLNTISRITIQGGGEAEYR